MTTRSDALATRLESGAQALATLAESLTPEQWQTRLPKDGRKIGVVVHHVANMYPLEIQLAQTLAEGKPISGVTWDAVHELNAGHATEQANVTREAALAHLRDDEHRRGGGHQGVDRRAARQGGAHLAQRRCSTHLPVLSRGSRGPSQLSPPRRNPCGAGAIALSHPNEKSMHAHRTARLLLATAVVAAASCMRATTAGNGSPNPPAVGPANGTVMVVGGGVVGPEIVARFIAAAGGPDALIVDVPTAGGDSVYPSSYTGANFLKAGGARNVVYLHTTDKKVANSDQFAGVLARAGGVWFEGGRQWHLVDSYAETKSERAFHDVLTRGGVVGGSSAGASILSSYMLRGARAGNEIIMAPGYEVGFGFLRGVAIDQHVVARERLRDLADSLMPKHPELLGISEDEGTAWVIHGDVADIVGRNKAFVYGGSDPTDPRKPFLTLYPGDRYDLAARRVLHRASDESPVSVALLDSIFGNASGMATVLVARDGKVLVDRSYGVPDNSKYMPGTTVPNFPLLGLSAPINALVAQLAAADGKLALERGVVPPASAIATGVGTTYSAYVTRRVFTPIGAHKTTVDSLGEFSSNVDELYRLELGLENQRAFIAGNALSAAPPTRDETAGWHVGRHGSTTLWSAFGTKDGTRNAFIRFPETRTTIIILTDRTTFDAGTAAARIADKLFPAA